MNERIEATVFFYFIDLIMYSFTERNIRQKMKEQEIESLPILVIGLKTKSPTWNNWIHTFRGLKRLFWLGPEGVITPSHIEVRHK